MVVDINLIKFYASVATDGGPINESALQTSSIVGNEISQITNSERSTGTIRYVKQFVKNENGESFGPVKIYLASTTQYSPKTSVAFYLTGSKSRLSVATALSGTSTVTATGYFETSNDLRLEVAPGEVIFNSSDDSCIFGVEVLEVATTYIQLSAGYAGTYGTGKTLSVAPATMATYVSPTSVSDVSAPTTTIKSLETLGVWKRYVVYDGCPYFENDWFTLALEVV